MSQISFKCEPWEYDAVDQIVERARKIALTAKVPFDRTATRMDLIATHANGNPIDFRRLLGADDFNLAHDVFGIARHLNRSTGALEDHFSPRCSQREAA